MNQVSYSELLRSNRDFRMYWAGQVVSQLGDWFSAITLQALLLGYGGTSASVAWLLMAQMLPNLVLGPVAGVLVDRLPRKTVMIGADLFRAAIALGLLGVRGPGTVWIAYAAAAGLSAFTAFFEPARIATLPNITSGRELVTANALSAVTWSVLLTSGAVVGGVIGHFFGPSVAFVLNSASFIASALFLSRMRVPPTERGPERSHGLGDLLGGIRYIRGHREVLGALTAKLGWGAAAGGIQVLIPVTGARVFPLPNDHNGQLSISLLFAASGLGTALGPIIARRWTGNSIERIRVAIAVAFLGGGGFYALGALAPNLGTAAGLFLLARLNGSIVWVFSTVLLQMLVEDRYRGRVFAAESSIFTGSMMLSILLTAKGLDSGGLSVPTATLALAAVSCFLGICWMVSLATLGIRQTSHKSPAELSDAISARRIGRIGRSKLGRGGTQPPTVNPGTLNRPSRTTGAESENEAGK